MPFLVLTGALADSLGDELLVFIQTGSLVDSVSRELESESAKASLAGGRGLGDLLTTGNLRPEADIDGFELVTTSGSAVEEISGIKRTPSSRTLTLSAADGGGETPLTG